MQPASDHEIASARASYASGAIDTCITNVLLETQKKRTVCQEGSKKELISLEGTVAASGSFGKHLELSWRQVGHGACLEVGPSVFDRIEIRSIGRQERAARSQRLTENPGYLGTAVSLEAVPDHHRTAGKMASQNLEERHYFRDADSTIWMQAEEKRQLVAARWNAQCSDGRDLLMRASPLKQHWRLALGRPAAANQWRHQEATLVNKDQGSLQSPGFFLMRGHSCLIQV